MRSNGKYSFLPYTPTSKITCPYCQTRKSFSVYFDTTTGGVLSPEFGRCDKVNRCGYNKSPYGNIAEPFTAAPNIQPEVKQRFIDRDIVARTVMWYDQNIFVTSVVNIFGVDSIKVLTDYFVGTTKDKDTVFWNIDATGRVWNAKIITYTTNDYGEPIRNKKSAPFHKFKSTEGYKPLLFGMHLLDKNKDTVMVEAEKSAIVGKIMQPEFNWIGTGGANGLTLAKAQLFKEMGYKKTIYCCGDCDQAGRTAMNKWVDYLESYQIKAKPYDLGDQYTNGEDFADLAFARIRQRRISDELLQRNSEVVNQGDTNVS